MLTFFIQICQKPCLMQSLPDLKTSLKYSASVLLDFLLSEVVHPTCGTCWASFQDYVPLEQSWKTCWAGRAHCFTEQGIYWTFNILVWLAHPLYIHRKDGLLSMVIDYRAVNQITVKNRYPNPNIDDLSDQLQGTTCFGSLDLRGGYHQIRISEEDAPRTAFRTPQGLFQFKVLPFGLTNALATFQKVMNDTFAPYMADLLLYTRMASWYAHAASPKMSIFSTCIKCCAYWEMLSCMLSSPNVISWKMSLISWDMTSAPRA